MCIIQIIMLGLNNVSTCAIKDDPNLGQSLQPRPPPRWARPRRPGPPGASHQGTDTPAAGFIPQRGRALPAVTPSLPHTFSSKLLILLRLVMRKIWIQMLGRTVLKRKSKLSPPNDFLSLGNTKDNIPHYFPRKSKNFHWRHIIRIYIHNLMKSKTGQLTISSQSNLMSTDLSTQTKPAPDITAAATHPRGPASWTLSPLSLKCPLLVFLKIIYI